MASCRSSLGVSLRRLVLVLVNDNVGKNLDIGEAGHLVSEDLSVEGAEDVENLIS